MPVTLANVHDVFSYHAPDGDQPARYQKLRMAAEQFAIVILQEVTNSGDQQAAIRHVREALMTANSGVATKGAV